MRIIKHILILSSLSLSQGFIHVENGQIVEGSGEPILLRGFGLGGWLVPEGYMLHNKGWIDGFESPTEIEAKIEELVGEDGADEFWNNYRDNYVSQADIDQIAEWGFNHIRIPFHYKQFFNPSGSQTPIGYEIIDSLLTWCEPYNMYVILDMHCAPGAQNGGPISDSDGTARLWLEENNKLLAIQIWREIADYYADNTLIAGYDLINEPVLPTGVTLTEFKQLYIDITTAIREVDQNHIVFIEGNWYGTDFTGLTPPWDDNMSYSFHKYWGETDYSTIMSYLSMSSTYDIPLWMGESGENSSAWYWEVFNLLEDNNIGWNFWTHKKVEKITSPFSVVVQPQYQTLIDYWSGSGSQPSSAYAEAALLIFTNSLKIENCITRPGVIASLTDPEYGSISKPFSAHSIPGTIPAVEYDIGTWGVSYTDSDYINNGDGGYNDGWSYRNDGVDIETNNNSSGHPYNIGWTETGEWLGYTIQDVEPGNYTLTVAVSAQNSGGIFFAQVNGQNVGVVNVPSTGGWYSWEDIPISSINITDTEVFLRIQIVQSGFNIESIKFEPVTVSVDQPMTTNEFKLVSAYPNPFNNNIEIPLTIGKPRNLTVEIFNLSGQSIIQLFSGNLDPGSHSFGWSGLNKDGNRVPSGTYFLIINDGNFSHEQKILLLK